MNFNIRTLVLPLSLATALAAAPAASSADYVQTGGALTFATAYQGETFAGSFPSFRTTMSFDPERPGDARLDVIIPLADGDTGLPDRDDGVLELRGISKPVTLEFTLSSGSRPELAGKARVSRLAFDVGGDSWADLSIIPDEVAVSARVRFAPAD